MKPERSALLIVGLILVLSAGLSAAEPDSLLGPPPGTYRIAAANGPVVIPFSLFRGDILMTGWVNGKPVRMMLDNGFLWDQILFFGSPTVDSLGLAYDGEAEVGGSGGGNAVQSRTASAITIGFPGVEFYDQTAIITPYESGLTNMWWGTEGQVSATFLKHFVVDIDYDQMQMTLTEPDRFTYTGKGVEVPMIPLLPGAWGIPAVIQFKDGTRAALDLMMDLGYGDVVELVEGGPNQMQAPANAIEGSLGFGAQGETRGHFGRLAGIEIGGYRLAGPIAAFVPPEQSSHTFHEAMVGMEVFRRFNLVFDYPHHRLFLEPNSHFAEPFEYNMSGMGLGKADGDTLRIDSIHPGSPASQAGLEIGDKVVKINDRPAGSYDTWELRPLLSQNGETVRLVIVRGSREKSVSLKLRRLI
jgi:hypothetical protein